MSGSYSKVLSGSYSDMSGRYSDVLSGSYSDVLSGSYSDVLSRKQDSINCVSRDAVCVIMRALGPGYTRDWLPAYSFVSRTRARRDTTRQDCFVVIPAHTGVTIVYCGTVVPSCSSQMSAR